jgi:UDP-2,4-diacetamido-2,4,6-trideoxy-beta-L-altropyranose hydrolase
MEMFTNSNDYILEGDKRKIAMCVDGNRFIGMGHVSSCVALASVLSETYLIYFIMRDFPVSTSFVAGHGYEVKTIDHSLNDQQYVDKLLSILKTKQTDLAVFDFLEMPIDISSNLEDIYTKSLLIDISGIYADKIHLKPDVIVNRSIIQERFQNYNLKSDKTKHYLGPEYVILKKDFILSHKKQRKIKKVGSKLLLSFGGGDNNNITSKVLSMLKEIQDINVNVVLGPAFVFEDEVKSILEGKTNFTILKGLKSLTFFMEECDLAICSGGTTAFELAASGTPALIVTGYEHEDLQALKFEEKGSVINFGMYKDISEDIFVETLNNILKDYELREQMSKKGKSITDGDGASRIKLIIDNLF